MKRINKYISLLLATALLASCDKFDEINTDPDATMAIYFNQFNRFNSILRDFPPTPTDACCPSSRG